MKNKKRSVSNKLFESIKNLNEYNEIPDKVRGKIHATVLVLEFSDVATRARVKTQENGGLK